MVALSRVDIRSGEFLDEVETTRGQNRKVLHHSVRRAIRLQPCACGTRVKHANGPTSSETFVVMTDTRLIRTVCDPNCHASPRCGITAHVQNGRTVKIAPGAFPLPEYDSRICAMGMARLEQQYHKDRLHHPCAEWVRAARQMAENQLKRGIRLARRTVGQHLRAIRLAILSVLRR
jgi:hypothetical protein